MPSVNLQLLKRDDQQHILSQLSGLASTAASVTLLAGREAYHSLKLLELGRGIIMGFAIDSRSDVSDLKANHQLKFYHLRVEINSLRGDMTYASEDQYLSSAMSRRWDAFKEMEAVLTLIRSLAESLSLGLIKSVQS
ncbi:hypothetical protein L873DRAFT_1924290 [Choiromyces venosus 120613-1]|uniref:Uncharacterized protein n=1 Tax=Choiromyces venosus 120613-1 TaxID=1336337 RepID=A0A3N4IRA5_9PEZI|nr:hypothetical protein L873DRAFT_1924290 [Choiromyces venosus 120613-1]